MTEARLPFANTVRFYSALGRFYATWTSVDLTVDLAICRLMNITPERTHALVAGLEFGRKSALLRSLLTLSKYERPDKLKGQLKKITKESLRNVFAHSFMATDLKSVSFIHRSSQGEYTATVYQLTDEQFLTHVDEFVDLTLEFQRDLGFSIKDLGEFAAMAIKEEKSA